MTILKCSCLLADVACLLHGWYLLGPVGSYEGGALEIVENHHDPKCGPPMKSFARRHFVHFDFLPLFSYFS